MKTIVTNATLTLVFTFRHPGGCCRPAGENVMQKRNEVKPSADTCILEHLLPQLGTGLHVPCNSAGCWEGQVIEDLFKNQTLFFCLFFFFP